MPGLGENIVQLVRNRREREAAAGASQGGGTGLADVPGFGSNPGGLRMLAYVPAGLAPGAPLVVALHGCTQTAAGYDAGAGWSRMAERHGFAVLLPEQTRGNNPNTCFNWFQPADTARGGGEAESIRQGVAHMVQAHRLNAARVYITGLSAGGAMTAAMLAAYPEVFAGGAVIAGLAHGAAHSMPEAFEAMGGRRHHSAREWGDLVRAASPHRGPWPRGADLAGRCGQHRAARQRRRVGEAVDGRAWASGRGDRGGSGGRRGAPGLEGQVGAGGAGAVHGAGHEPWHAGASGSRRPGPVAGNGSALHAGCGHQLDVAHGAVVGAADGGAAGADRRGAGRGRSRRLRLACCRGWPG